eukprot:c8789_g1_i1 orf=788-1504(+)
MSQPRVTVTVGQGGQRSATISSGKVFSDRGRGITQNRKRSVKDRLGGSPRNVSASAYQMSSKRQRQETGWNQRAYEDEHEDVSLANLHNVQNPRQDLRYKLDQKTFFRSRQFLNGSAIVGNDLRERISGPPHPPQGQRIVVRRHPSLTSKGIPVIRTLPPPAAIASRIKAVQKVSVAIEQPTVATLLQSLGLGKYSITFKAEEIDMTALRNMSDDDLKELGLPMGPRKKLLIALSTRM